MLAFAEGKPIQYQSELQSWQWLPTTTLTHIDRYPFRPAPDPIAPGHNPKALPKSKIGEGFRLVEASEGIGVTHSQRWHEATNFWNYFENKWDNLERETEAYWVVNDTLRTRLSPSQLAALDKPAWKMPDPPKGKEWHRGGWTEEDLPELCRPLLMNEPVKPGDEYFTGARWKPLENPTHRATHLAHQDCLRPKHRTRRPLPPSRRQWSRASDVPGPVCWIRTGQGAALLVTVISPSGVTGGAKFIYWDLLHTAFEHSTDRVNWLPCDTEDGE